MREAARLITEQRDSCAPAARLSQGQENLLDRRAAMAGKRRAGQAARKDNFDDLREVRAEWLKTAITTFRSKPIPPARANRSVRQIGGRHSGLSRRRAGD